MKEKKIERLETIREWVERNQPGYNWGVTTFASSVEEVKEMFLVNPEIGKDRYKRYGYSVSHYFAQRFAEKVAGIGWDGRFYNSGMSAITTAIEATQLESDDHILVGKVLYPESLKIYENLKRFKIKVELVESNDIEKIKVAIQPQTRLIHIETVGNGLEMPVIDFKQLLEYCWQKEIVIILDNTFPTSIFFNPFKVYQSLREREDRVVSKFVYVESLSKFYRATEVDGVTAGVIIASPGFIEDCDKAMAYQGTYLPTESLKRLPVDLLRAARRIVIPANQKATALSSWLVSRLEVRFVAQPKQSVGGIVYFLLNTEDRDVTCQFADVLECPIAGSFGHPVTTIFPLGALRESFPPGAVRIAVGWQESVDEVIKKFEKALEQTFLRK